MSSSTIKEATRLYKKLAQTAYIESGRILPNGQVLASFKQKNLVDNSWSKFNKIFTESGNLTLPKNANAILSAFSNDSQRKASISKTAKSTDDKPEYQLEITDFTGGNVLSRSKLENPKSEKDEDQKNSNQINFKSIVANRFFGGFLWDEADENLCFMVEKKPVNDDSKNFTDVQEDKDFETAGQKTAWKESFGELLGDNFRSILAIYNLESQSLMVHDYGEDWALSNPVFTPNGDVLLIAENVTPFKLGRVYCTNKKSKIVKFNTKTQKFSDLYDNKTCVASLVKCPKSDDPNVIHTTFFFQERSVGYGPHYDCMKLNIFEYTEDSIISNLKVHKVVDYVESFENEQNCDFLGMYNLGFASRPFYNQNLVFSTTSKSKEKLFVFPYNSGAWIPDAVVTLKVPEQYTQVSVLDVFGDKILLSCSSINIEPTLALYTIPENLNIPEGDFKVLDQGKTHGDVSFEIVDFGLNEDGQVESSANNDGCLWQGIYVSYKDENPVALPKGQSPPKNKVILRPHGGPHSVYMASWYNEVVLMAKLGYSQMLVNYRGSTGFGRAGLRTLPGRCGVNDVNDCVEALKFCHEHKNCDPEQSFITGGSHGGFLTCHLIGQFPDMFKAAVSRNPVTNLPVMIGTTDIPDWCYYEVVGQESVKSETDESEIAEFVHPGVFDGDYYKKAFECSPMAHVKNVKTPVLLQLGQNDARVPPSQGISYHRAVLGSKGVSKISWYPKDSHPLDSVEACGDVSLNLVKWFDQYGN